MFVCAGQLIVNVAGMEVLFTVAHRALHAKIPQLHVLHHVCRTPSYTTNFLFDVNDIALEFTGPMVFCVLSHVLYFHDPFALYMSLVLMSVHNITAHDEWLRAPHWYHHKNVDSVYTLYTHIRDYRPGFDKVKVKLS